MRMIWLLNKILFFNMFDRYFAKDWRNWSEKGTVIGNGNQYLNQPEIWQTRQNNFLGLEGETQVLRYQTWVYLKTWSKECSIKHVGKRQLSYRESQKFWTLFNMAEKHFTYCTVYPKISAGPQKSLPSNMYRTIHSQIRLSATNKCLPVVGVAPENAAFINNLTIIW